MRNTINNALARISSIGFNIPVGTAGRQGQQTYQRDCGAGAPWGGVSPFPLINQTANIKFTTKTIPDEHTTTQNTKMVANCCFACWYLDFWFGFVFGCIRLVLYCLIRLTTREMSKEICVFYSIHTNWMCKLGRGFDGIVCVYVPTERKHNTAKRHEFGVWRKQPLTASTRFVFKF